MVIFNNEIIDLANFMELMNCMNANYQINY